MRSPVHQKEGNSWTKPTTIIAFLAAIVIFGYDIIFMSTNFSNTKAFEDKILSIQMSANMLNKDLITKQAELKELKGRLRGMPSNPIVSTAVTAVVPTITAFKPYSASESPVYRPGVIVLGMHRSGTSVLGGLINKMGLNTGGPLIQAAEDNAKGFFERIDVVLQNDAFMSKQRIHYAGNTYKYDPLLALKHLHTDPTGKFFKEGDRGLAFLNNPANYPWMLKDPRLCITFRTWLPLLHFIPAILFTYRHPYDVAMSMHKREFEHFAIQRGLKLWYVYNKQAIVQSRDLCRVVTSHRKVMTQPVTEFTHIFESLHTCGVPVPHRLTDAVIADFIDVKLQHGKSTLKDDHTCTEDLSNIAIPSTWETTDPDHVHLYRESMKLYCAMENGKAFVANYAFDESITDA